MFGLFTPEGLFYPPGSERPSGVHLQDPEHTLHYDAAGRLGGTG